MLSDRYQLVCDLNDGCPLIQCFCVSSDTSDTSVQEQQKKDHTDGHGQDKSASSEAMETAPAAQGQIGFQ